MFDVVALGEILIDFTPAGFTAAGGRCFEQNPGGAPANVLAVVSKFGGTCAFIGKVGADMFGEFLRGKLLELSIDCRNLITDPGYNTTLAFVSIDEKGDRSFSFCRNHGADTRLAAEEVDLELIGECRVFHFGTLSMTHEPARSATMKALRAAKELKRIISFDPNYRPLLWDNENGAVDAMKVGLAYADIAKLSLEEARMITGETSPAECLKALLAYGLSFAAVTMGPQGCMYATNKYTAAYPEFPANVVDTTGAGDTFWGTVLFGLLKLGGDVDRLSEKELADMVLIANIAAGMSTERKGAIPSIPDYARVREAFDKALG